MVQSNLAKECGNFVFACLIDYDSTDAPHVGYLPLTYCSSQIGTWRYEKRGRRTLRLAELRASKVAVVRYIFRLLAHR